MPLSDSFLEESGRLSQTKILDSLGFKVDILDLCSLHLNLDLSTELER